MEELLKRHIQESDRRFEDIYEGLVLLSSKVDDLRDFKTQLLISSRFFSFVVSALVGIFVFIASSVTTYYIAIKTNH